MKRIRHLIFDNFGWKVLSLAVAVLLWAIVSSEPRLSTFVSLRLGYKDLPTDLEISSEPVGPVSLELSGPSGEFRGVGDGALRPAVIIDMSGVQPGERTFTIGDRNVQLPRGVRLVRSIPSQIRFRFEKRAERSVPVAVRFTGEGTHGYRLARYEVEPKELRIAGPESRVARIRSVTTDEVDVSNTVGTAEFHVNAFVDDPYVRFASPPRVKVEVTMAMSKK